MYIKFYPLPLVVVALFYGISALNGQPKSARISEGVKSTSEKNVVLFLEQCLDRACKKTSPIGSAEAMELAPILWNIKKKRGVTVLGKYYRGPNSVHFGDVDFDYIAFNPARKMSLLYGVERRTAWQPVNSQYVHEIEAEKFAVRLPRRESTLLIGPLNDVQKLKMVTVSAIREFAGVPLNLFAIFKSAGFTVRWNNNDYLAFPNLKIGVAYTIEIAGKAASNDKAEKRVNGIIWRNPYRPIPMEL